MSKTTFPCLIRPDDVKVAVKPAAATHEDTLFLADNLAKLLDESGRTEEAARLRSEYGTDNGLW